MTIAAGIFLIAIGAVIRYGLNLNVAGVKEDVIGLILIIAGVLGLVLSLLQEALWSDRARRRDHAHEDPRYDRRPDDRY